MYKSLMTDLLSIKADLPRTIELAARHGFGGIDTSAASLIKPDVDTAAVRAAMEAANLRAGYVSLSPGRVPASPDDWRAAMEALPTVAKRAQELGFHRAGLVVLPFHETLPFDQAFADHVSHLNEMLPVLNDFGISVGLEYVAPLSRRAGYANPFIYTLSGMLRLCAAADYPNVGILLDSFHWYCAGETRADIEALTPEKVVVVHINDAPPVPLAEQVVGTRTLPGETGVIDTAGFIGALQTIGYDGPLTCEPMASAIAGMNAQNDDEIVALTSAAMDRVL